MINLTGKSVIVKTREDAHRYRRKSVGRGGVDEQKSKMLRM